jgi:hypothetical protein
VRREVEESLRHAQAAEPVDQERMRLHLAVLERKRHELLTLVEEGEIEDSVMWEVQRLFDYEEARLEAQLDAAPEAAGATADQPDASLPAQEVGG